MSRRLLIGGWLLAMATAMLFTGLGLWQTTRGREKARMLESSAATVQARDPRPLTLAADLRRTRNYDWAAGRGRFLATPLLLDNQQYRGRVGVRAYAVFQPESGPPLLAELGWLALPGDRRLPAIAIPSGTQQVRGLLAPPPSPGLRKGAAMAPAGDGWLMLRLDPVEAARALRLPGPLAPRVLRLDPTLPIGYERDLVILANTLTPERHRGYAVQWFGLAITALVIAVVLTLRGIRR